MRMSRTGATSAGSSIGLLALGQEINCSSGWCAMCKEV
jgi:hypothetical protein